MLREFVITNREAIISRCRSKSADRGTPAAPRSEIDHGVPVFLDELVDELRLKRLKNSQISKTATKHGHDLQHRGFSVSQVVHGYGDVCQTITEMAVELKASISADDFRMLNRALDDAIAAAVTQHGSERDRSIEGEAADENERAAVLAHRLGAAIHIARGALDAIQTGRVGIAGTTGTALDRSLVDAKDLIDRLLSTDVFVARRRHASENSKTRA
jgi:hypothetical protein